MGSESNHEHVLELFENHNGELLCPGCGDPSFGESYSCSNCGCFPQQCTLCDKISPTGDSFVMCMLCWPQSLLRHYSCYKYSREDLNISCHPHGPLFYEELTSGSHKMECDFCYKTHRDFKFCCKECDFMIGFPCALRFSKYHEGREHVQHFRHRHPLTSFRVDDMTLLELPDMNCQLCFKIINGPSYGCAPCEYFIHSSCREWLQEIRHPFHPKHSLTLGGIRRPFHPVLNPTIEIDERGKYTCMACCIDIKGLRYKCKECKFYLHPECSSLKPSIKYEGHPHLVTLIEKFSYQSKCTACGFDIEGDFLVRCVECSLDFHVQCDSPHLPLTVLHEQHNLTLTLSTDQTLAKDDSHPLSCNSCGKKIHMEDPFYYCTECEYFAHVRCAVTNIQGDDKEKLRHSSHEHVLILDEIQKTIDVLCHGCKHGIQGPAYGCYPCKFYLHKACADLPGKIGHEYHDEHYLFLKISDPEAKGACHNCHKQLNGFTYNCDICKFDLDLECASQHPSINPEKIGHYSHPHPLSDLEVEGVRCKLCYEKINGSCYGCIPCGFYVHKSCSELPQKIQNHPLHPRHSLQLLDIKPELFGCAACLFEIKGITYVCHDCTFYLHPECTDLKPNIKYEGHEHLLTLIEAMSFMGYCAACHLEIEGAYFLHCVECSINFHVQCGPLPLPSLLVHEQHEHPLHLIRDETLVKDDSGLHCNACKEEITNPKHCGYYCAKCEYYAHMRCVITEQVDEKEKLLHFSHRHILFPIGNDENDVSFGNKKNGDVFCCACEKLIQVEPAYGCHHCKFYLHKSCVDLPKELQHPFHRHPLTLPKHYSEDKTHRCNACRRSYNSFTYSCQKCDFNLDFGCSFLQPSIKSDTHQHTLTFFKKLYGNLRCGRCMLNIPADKSNPVDFYCLRCVCCNYSLHLSCHGLPETIEHDSHQHSLTLKDNFIDLGFECDGDYYCCDVCETRRYPRECVYFCEECSYVVDIDCLMPEVMQCLEDKLEDVKWRVVSRQITQKEIAVREGLTFKDIVKSLTDQETKTIEEAYTWKDFNMKIVYVRSYLNLEHRTRYDLCQSMAKDLAQGRMQLERIGEDAEAGLVNVRGYKINPKFVSILKTLLDKYGDIGEECPWNERLKTIILVTFCAIVQEMSNTVVKDVRDLSMVTWLFSLNLVRRAGFRIDFALDHLNRIAEDRYLMSEYQIESNELLVLHEEMDRLYEQINSQTAKIESLREETEEFVSSHTNEQLRTKAERWNRALGLRWQNAASGFL